MFRWIQTFYKIKASLSVIIEHLCKEKSPQNHDLILKIMEKYAKQVTLNEADEKDLKDNLFHAFMERDEKQAMTIQVSKEEKKERHKKKHQEMKLKFNKDKLDPKAWKERAKVGEEEHNSCDSDCISEVFERVEEDIEE